jgi:hypothetical protein
VDEDVRDTIEKAILHRKKVKLISSSSTKYEEVVVSVSHFMFMPPDITRVVCWEDNAEHETNEESQQYPLEIALEKIDRAELLDEAAVWPKEYYPLKVSPEHDGKFDEVLDIYDLRVSPRLMKIWKGKWIESQLELIGQDDQGWTVCRFRSHLNESDTYGMMDFFYEHSRDLELLAPIGRRGMMQGRVNKVAAMYSDVQVPPIPELKRRNAEWFKAMAKLNRGTKLWF